ncbi:MAG: CbiX/SirB N-terminal domain-containing protein [Mariprofundaceae bacterium]|nr:CbiX/SirB N-terminal domain-containing protein [Mariprofundaceae bacterium]
MFFLLAHGSSHAKHAQQVTALAKEVSALLEEEVGAVFLSDESLPQGASVLPLFLGNGRHMSQDVPQLMKASDATMLRPLVEAADELANLIIRKLTQTSKRLHVVFVVYQFTGFEKIVAALYKHGKGCSLIAVSALHGQPNINSVLHNIQKQGVKKVLLQPVLLFDGHSLNACKMMAEEAAIEKKFEVEIMPVLVGIDGMVELIANRLKTR